MNDSIIYAKVGTERDLGRAFLADTLLSHFIVEFSSLWLRRISNTDIGMTTVFVYVDDTDSTQVVYTDPSSWVLEENPSVYNSCVFQVSCTSYA